jgi:hypothetical protein
MTFQDFCNKLKNKENFSLSRFGDGEWSAVLGFKGSNCDGHDYFPEMGEKLGDILKSNPEYHIATHLKSSDRLRVEVEDYIKENNIKVNFSCSSDLFHMAFVRKQMPEFFEAIKDRNILIVGPDYLKAFNPNIVEVSKVNCYLQTEKVIKEIEKHLASHLVVLFCASMASNVWIDRLYSKDYTLIDLGSALDPYCGVLSRSFHRNKPIV